MNDKCLICDRQMTAEELAGCARRHDDGWPVCVSCVAVLKNPKLPGHIDARDKWFDRRPVRN